MEMAIFLPIHRSQGDKRKLEAEKDKGNDSPPQEIRRKKNRINMCILKMRQKDGVLHAGL